MLVRRTVILIQPKIFVIEPNNQCFEPLLKGLIGRAFSTEDRECLVRFSCGKAGGRGCVSTRDESRLAASGRRRAPKMVSQSRGNGVESK